MFYLENNTTFSGADIKIYAYRDPSDFSKYADLDEKKLKNNNTNPRYPDDPFVDTDPKDLDMELSDSLENIASGRAKSIKQKDIVLPDGTFSTVDATDTQEIENQYAAPQFRDLEQTVSVTVPGGTIRTLSEVEALNLANSILESNPEHDVNITYNDLQSEVTYADGSTEIVSLDEAADISASHVDVQVINAPDKVDYTAVQTNKVNPNYIDIVKHGSDKAALKLARDHQLAKMNKNRNAIFNEDGTQNRTATKPIIELGSLYSITYSSFREKSAIRTLGRVSAKDYTRGQRTIAGSMNFAIFQSHELMDFLKSGENASQIVLLDQLPKFNLMLIMTNEYGGASILHLFNVTISTESQQSSVEDLALMNNVTFYAEDIMTIENVGNVFETSLAMLHPTIIAGKTLRFYNKNSFTTLGSLLSINNDTERNSKITALLSKSRGLF
jgi:hypothetical protein